MVESMELLVSRMPSWTSDSVTEKHNMINAQNLEVTIHTY